MKEDLQYVFDRVCKALIKQGEGSFAPNGSCRYRGMAGNKCAVGHLIKDAHIWHLEGLSVCTAAVSDAVMRSLLPDLKQRGLTVGQAEAKDRLMPLLQCLQAAHDQADYRSLGYDRQVPEQWLLQFKLRASEAAKKYGLNPKILEG